MNYFPCRIKVQFTTAERADAFATAINALMASANKTASPNDHAIAIRPSSMVAGGDHWVYGQPGLVAQSDAESLKAAVSSELSDTYYDGFIETSLTFEHIDHDNQESGWQATA